MKFTIDKNRWTAGCVLRVKSSNHLSVIGFVLNQMGVPLEELNGINPTAHQAALLTANGFNVKQLQQCNAKFHTQFSDPIRRSMTGRREDAVRAVLETAGHQVEFVYGPNDLAKYHKVAALRASLWIKACEAASIPADSKFVVFDPSEMYSRAYNRAALLACELRNRWNRQAA